ncbi:putative 5-formyltetrahydrofolate cyclo-ligase [Diplodia seriata]|uniref:Putative 5-formyltetrahydrofolate cyclo-ligase n=1 Tax=Diplodia seriata TaxID=420778 RepID=A0A0G2FPP1_9PEZI|nr:putative 5-formyltetrahydrofolate cyclo-ligase [Diplodia seriata]
MPSTTPAADLDLDAHKAAIRARIWAKLSTVALPDSRFDRDFSSFIADFRGSSSATDRLVSLPEWRAAALVFVAPDNCLEELRARALQDGKTLLVTAYGIRRGFWVVRPEDVGERGAWYAATLDGVEKSELPSVPIS